MNCFSSLRCQLSIFLIVAGMALPCCGKEPDLAALLAKLPVLSSENEELKSFSLRGQANIQDGLVMNFHVAWKEPDEAAMLVSVGEQAPAPVLFHAHGRMLLVDYFRNVVTLHDLGVPQLTARVDEEKESISFNLSVTTKKPSKILADLGSFLRGNGDAARWERQADGLWRHTNVSKSGSSKIVADFDPAHGYPLRKLQIISGERTVLSFSEMTINQPLPQHLQSFPQRDGFPDDLVVESKAFRDDKKSEQVVEIIKQFFSGLLATAAIENAELREAAEILGRVDWEQAERNRRTYAPQLLKMLGSSEAK